MDNRERLEHILYMTKDVEGYDNLSAHIKEELLLIQEEVNIDVQYNDMAAEDFAIGEGSYIIDEMEQLQYPEGKGELYGRGYMVHRNGVIMKNGEPKVTRIHNRTKLVMVQLRQFNGKMKWHSVAHMVLDCFAKEPAPCKNYNVLFRDRDTANCHIDNLKAIRGRDEEDSI